MILVQYKSAEAVNQALKLILKQDKILSITADNGTEFNRLSDVFSEEHIYYAHPYASWERGTNENHNRLIRRWLPKGTKKTTPKEVAFIENWINNYPKKCLNYKSPREDFFMANLNLKFGKRESRLLLILHFYAISNFNWPALTPILSVLPATKSPLRRSSANLSSTSVCRVLRSGRAPISGSYP